MSPRKGPLRSPLLSPLIPRINQRGELNPYETGLTPPPFCFGPYTSLPLCEPFEDRISSPFPPFFPDLDPTPLSPLCESILDQIKISPTEMGFPATLPSLLINKQTPVQHFDDPHPFCNTNPPSMRRWCKLVYKEWLYHGKSVDYQDRWNIVL